MPMTQLQQDFVGFMEEYTDFLERMVADENEKLAALSSRELKRIEHSITVSQANAKQLDNYEAKRIALQSGAGFDGMSFRELLDAVPEEQRGPLKWLFARFERSVSEIRFRNDKSMLVARDHMLDIDPAAVIPLQPGAKAANPYEKLREEQAEAQSGMMETKA